MEWSDERYVRLYTRDTPDWVALGWEAQALLMLLMRKMDRAGVLHLGKSQEHGLAAMLHMPAEVVTRALARLLDDGCFERVGNSLVMRNFLPAQEARQSDRHRQAESRASRRAVSRNAESLNTCHTVSNNDQYGHSVPSRTVPYLERDIVRLPPDAPSQPDVCAEGSAAPVVEPTPSEPSPSRPRAKPMPLIKARAETVLWVEWFNRTFGRAFTLRTDVVRAVQALLGDRHTQGAMRLVALHLRGEWSGDPKMEVHLVPSTLLKRQRFAERLEVARQAQPALASQFDDLDAKPIEARLAAAREKTQDTALVAAIGECLRDLGAPLLRPITGGKSA